MAEDDDSDKQHEPTQKKLDDARKKGEIPRSADLTTAAAYGGFLLAALAVGGGTLSALAGRLAGLLGHADTLSAEIFAGGSGVLTGRLMGRIVADLAPWFVTPAVAAMIALVVQRAVVFAPEKLQPKLSRISPLSNARNKFGRSGLFEFAKSFTKLSIYAVVLGIYLWRQLPRILSVISGTDRGATLVLFDLSIGFFAIIIAIATGIGGVDFLWQRAEHMRRHRMSTKELRDEMKQQEGDPHMKQQRRQRGYDIAMNQMLADVPGADVVIVNPTHYAVALTWSREPGSAPVCVAKGVDEIAARIREIAEVEGVPIHRDPPTARAIHAGVEIGQEIHPDLYRPVAAAIRFAEKMRQRARRFGTPRPRP